MYLNCLDSLEIKNEKFECTEFYYFVCFPNDCRTEGLNAIIVRFSTNMFKVPC